MWFEKTYTGPAMIHGDTVLQDQGGLRPLDRQAQDAHRSDHLRTSPVEVGTQLGCTLGGSEHCDSLRAAATSIV